MNDDGAPTVPTIGVPEVGDLHMHEGRGDGDVYCEDIGEPVQPQGGSVKMCPIISAHIGQRADCIFGGCTMWVDPDHGMKTGNCGFKLLSVFAQIEIARIMDYKEIGV